MLSKASDRHTFATSWQQQHLTGISADLLYTMPCTNKAVSHLVNVVFCSRCNCDCCRDQLSHGSDVPISYDLPLTLLRMTLSSYIHIIIIRAVAVLLHSCDVFFFLRAFTSSLGFFKQHPSCHQHHAHICCTSTLQICYDICARYAVFATHVTCNFSSATGITP
jgi:hypothetical protein